MKSLLSLVLLLLAGSAGAQSGSLFANIGPKDHPPKCSLPRGLRPFKGSDPHLPMVVCDACQRVQGVRADGYCGSCPAGEGILASGACGHCSEKEVLGADGHCVDKIAAKKAAEAARNKAASDKAAEAARNKAASEKAGAESKRPMTVLDSCLKACDTRYPRDELRRDSCKRRCR